MIGGAPGNRLSMKKGNAGIQNGICRRAARFDVCIGSGFMRDLRIVD